MTIWRDGGDGDVVGRFGYSVCERAVDRCKFSE